MAVFTNLLANPENFGAWTTIGTPVVTSGQTDPFGGTNAFLVGDDDAGNQERIQEAINFTGDGDKSFSLFIKEGPDPDQSNVRIADTTATEFMGLAITWSNGVPSLSGQAELLSLVEYPNGWWRFSARASGITSANSHEYQIVPATPAAAPTGNVLVFGATAHNETTAGAYPGDGDNGRYWRQRSLRRVYPDFPGKHLMNRRRR